MSSKYSFKDALLEAGVRDYREIQSDNDWVPSEKYEKATAALAKKKDKSKFFSFSSGLGKGLSVAAAVVILFGVAAAIKPVREAIASSFGTLFGVGETTYQTGEDPSTDPESTGKTPAVVTDTQTETETEPETTEEMMAAVTDETEYENDIEYYLLQLADQSKYGEAFDYLFNRKDAEEVFRYCIDLLLKKERSEPLLNGAGHFLYDFFIDVTEYESYIKSEKNKDEAMKLDMTDYEHTRGTRYIKWFEKFCSLLEADAPSYSEAYTKKYEYVYYLLKARGFNNWDKGYQNTADEAIENTLTTLFDLYNAVMTGVAPDWCMTVPVSSLTGELEKTVKSFWGDEKRDFIRVMNLSAQDFKEKFANITNNVSADLFFGNTKYFIIHNNNVYLTQAKETDTDAHTYKFVEVTKKSETSATMPSLYGYVKALFDGEEIQYHYDFYDAYSYMGFKCTVRGNYDKAVQEVLLSHGEKTIIKALQTYASKGTEEPFAYYLCTSSSEGGLRNDALDYILAHYFSETDESMRAAMGRMFYEITLRYNVYELKQLVPEANSLFTMSDGTSMSNASMPKHKSDLAVFINRCVDVFKKLASDYHETVFKTDFPYYYKTLCAVGFDGYIPGEPDISYYARDAIRAVNELYQAVAYGFEPDALSDKRHPIESDEDRIGLPEQEKNDYYVYYMLSDFYACFEKYLDRSVIDGFMHNSDWFNVIGDRVYMFNGGPQGILGIKVTTARLVSQSGNTAKIAVDVSLPYGMFSYTRNMIFEIKEYKGGIRVTGGIFLEKFLKPEYSKAGAVSYIIPTYLLMQEAQYEFCEYTDGALYNNYDDVPEKYRDVLTKDFDYPLYYSPYYYNSYELDRYTTKEAAEAIIKTSGVYDGVALYQNKAKVKHTPVFEYGFEYEQYGFTAITWSDVLLYMDVIECSDDRILFSLDFIKEENGKTEKVTYTFEVIKTVNENGYEFSCLVGGTFYTDVIMKNN